MLNTVADKVKLIVLELMSFLFI